jgi:methyl-accepting chemotaxis protein WspA
MDATQAGTAWPPNDQAEDLGHTDTLVEDAPGQHFEALQRELQGDPQGASPQPKPTPNSSGMSGQGDLHASNGHAPNNRQRQGLSIASKISGGMGILTLIIVVISAVAISIMSEIRTQMTTIVSPAVQQTKLAEQMSLTLYDALLLEEDYINTENEFKLTAASQELERLKTHLVSATELAKDIEKHIDIKLGSFFAEMDRLLTNHVNDVQEIGKAIQTARESNQAIRTESKAAQSQLLGGLKDSRNRISSALEDHWIQTKRLATIPANAIVFGQTLSNLEEQIADIQFNVLKFTTSDSLMLANTIRQQAQEFINTIDRVRTDSSDEKVQLMLRDVRSDMRSFMEGLDLSIELIEQRTVELAENKAFIDAKKASMIESADLLFKSFDDTRNRTWGRIENSTDTLSDLSLSSTWIVTSIALLGGLIGLAVLVFVPRPIIATVRELLSASSTIASGNLTQPIASNSKDELGALADQMEQMRQNLLTLISEVSGAVLNASSLSNEIMASTNQQGSSSTEMAAQVNQVKSSVTEQVSSMTEMNQSLEGISQFAQSSTEKSKDSVEQAQIALEGMDNIANANEGASQRIQLLREKIEEISKVLTVISEVADQTNLLSLNASIESTKAGESGKGFSVVAGEIRRLADRSMLAAQNINDIVHDIQRASESAVMSMQKSSEEIRVGSESVTNTVSNLQEIVNNVAQISSQTEDMTRVLGQQTEASRVIGDSMQNISLATDMSAGASQQINKAIAELNNMVGQLRGTVVRFKTS